MMKCLRCAPRALAVAVVLVALAPAGVQAQTHKDTIHGYQIKPPRDYEAIPVQPNQRISIARFKSTKLSIGGGAQGHNTLEVDFYPASMRPDDQDEEEFYEELVTELEKREGYCDVEKDKETSVDRMPARERYLIPEGGDAATYQMFLFQDDGVFVVTGRALKDKFKKDVRDFSKAAKSFKRIEKEATSDEGGDRSQMSEQERFLQAQIDKLPRGWDHMRTDRYLFLFNAEKSFVREMGKQIEAIRDTYEELYPPEGEGITAVSIVRVCDSQQDYFGYGGREGTGGYWSSGQRELVFFDMSPRAFTLAVLNHEAFHQYIYYFYGELAPHSWYNEGHGDYFAGAKLSASYRVMSFGNAGGGIGRLETAKRACMLRQQGKSPDEGAAFPLKDLMRFSQAEFYGKNKGLNYAQAWALVHMLRENKRLEEKWDRILPEYLENLLAARLEVATGMMNEAREKDESAPGDPEAYFPVASTDAIQALAYEKTFAEWSEQDWEAFDSFFLEYVEKL